MNGRAYDPAVARFLSPDPFIQAPGDWGNYNRYGYCMNNPLVYSDPSGYNWLKDAWKGATNAYHWFFNTMNDVGDFLEDNNISVNYQSGVNINRSGNAQITSNGIPVYNTAKAERYDPAKNVEVSLSKTRNDFYAQKRLEQAGIHISTNFDPSISLTTTVELFHQSGLSMDYYTSRTIYEGLNSTDYEIDARTGKFESVTTESDFGFSVSWGVDYSITNGFNGLSIGSISNKKLVIDLSIPTGDRSAYGTTIYINRENSGMYGNSSLIT